MFFYIARVFGRAWGPVAAAFEGDASRLAWMPSHCSSHQVGKKKLSDGSFMTESDRRGNAFVDTLAKQAATWDRVPKAKLLYITQQSERLTAIAKWIGQCGVIANHFKKPAGLLGETPGFIRDSEGIQGHTNKPRKVEKRKRVVDDIPCSRPGDLSLCPRWAALRQRIFAKSGMPRADYEH